MFKKKKKKSKKKKKKKKISRFFQHFPSLSRNQDHEGNNTPASDDRGGRNFHLPNICTTHYNKYFKIVLFFFAIGLFHFHFFFSITCCLHPSTYVEIQT